MHLSPTSKLGYLSFKYSITNANIVIDRGRFVKPMKNSKTEMSVV